MSRTPPPNNDDLRLSEDEIRAMSQGLRQQYASEERGVVSAVGTTVASGIEGMIRRILILLRWPIRVLIGLGGFLFFSSREGVSFLLAVGLGIAAFVLAGWLHGVVIYVIDQRAYRREIR